MMMRRGTLFLASQIGMVYGVVMTTSLLRSTEVTLGNFVISRPRQSLREEPSKGVVAADSSVVLPPAEEWVSQEDIATAAAGAFVGVAAHLPVASSMLLGLGFLWAAEYEKQYGIGLLARGMGTAGVVAYSGAQDFVTVVMESEAGKAGKKALDDLIEAGSVAIKKEADKRVQSATTQLSQTADAAKDFLRTQFDALRPRSTVFPTWPRVEFAPGVALGGLNTPAE